MEGNTPPVGEAVAVDPRRQRRGLIAARHARRSRRVKTIMAFLLLGIDAGMLVLAFVLAYIARETLPVFYIPNSQPSILQYAPTILLHVGIIMAIFYFSRFYHMRRAISRIDHARNLIGAITIGALMVNSIQDLVLRNTLYDPVDYPRSLFFYVWIFSTILVIAGRELHRAIRRLLRTRRIERDNLLIVGMGNVAREITRRILTRPDLGYNVVGMIPVRPKGKQTPYMGIPVIGSAHELPSIIDSYGIDQVIIALPDPQRSELVDLITLCQRGRVDIKVYPDMFAYMAGDLSVDDLGGTPLITVRDTALRGWKLSLKRGLDIVGSMLGLILLSPFMLLTAILIKLESPGGVFFTQQRMGLDGRPFHMIKFRSMRSDAEANGPGWTVPGDPRVTRVGAFMRKTNWDEIPQLINVLIGEMSLVGPRPERPVYVQQFREMIPRYMERHREKAGMTGWAQVNGLRGDTSIADRTSYDLWYVENWSLWLDIKIIMRTVMQTILRRDANAY
ncbi:MAG: undecaprenyl-phosphate glucose phosphotransferase [bacterium]|nr:undecaprenyl-phosphate glucose phosphotransferase [bacterium]